MNEQNFLDIKRLIARLYYDYFNEDFPYDNYDENAFCITVDSIAIYVDISPKYQKFFPISTDEEFESYTRKGNLFANALYNITFGSLIVGQILFSSKRISIEGENQMDFSSVYRIVIANSFADIYYDEN